MSDQEITDRDETRRLAYVLLAAAAPDVRLLKLHDLLGTLAHALTHHSGENRTAVSGVYVLDQLRVLLHGGTPQREDEARRWLYGQIDRLGDDIEALKRPAPLVTADDVEAIPDTPRRTFLKVVYAALDNVANDPGARWFEGDSSGDTMHEIEVALDAYAGFLTRLGGAEDAPWVAQAEVDLAQALDLLAQVIDGLGVEHGGTARWVAQARARQTERTP